MLSDKSLCTLKIAPRMRGSIKKTQKFLFPVVTPVIARKFGIKWHWRKMNLKKGWSLGISFCVLLVSLLFWLKGALVIISCIQKRLSSNQNKVVTKYCLISWFIITVNLVEQYNYCFAINIFKEFLSRVRWPVNVANSVWVYSFRKSIPIAKSKFFVT